MSNINFNPRGISSLGIRTHHLYRLKHQGILVSISHSVAIVAIEAIDRWWLMMSWWSDYFFIEDYDGHRLINFAYRAQLPQRSLWGSHSSLILPYINTYKVCSISRATLSWLILSLIYTYFINLNLNINHHSSTTSSLSSSSTCHAMSHDTSIRLTLHRLRMTLNHMPKYWRYCMPASISRWG